jgi:OOP family OmpA-OmpF porin
MCANPFLKRRVQAMNESSASGVEHDARLKNPMPMTDGLTELRALLIGPEQTQLHDLQARVEVLATRHRAAEEVGQILPEAIVRRSQPDIGLTQALTPTIESALQASIRKDPRTLVEAIFPIIGPTIRKAIAEALRSMLQSLNQLLEHSMSIRGLRWRLEAWRTGQPFAEVVLLHTILYRVEQLFLIHRHTGLLLCHVVADPAMAREPEVVSGMLTAIQDFVHDAFTVRNEATLDAFRVGELTVWVEYGPHALLAAVIRGTPVQEVRTTMQETLEVIHLEHGPALAVFDGDTGPFVSTRGRLEAGLMMQAVTASQRLSPVLVGVVVCLLLLLGAWGWLSVREARRWSAYVQRLRMEPGIVITNVTRRHGQYILSGLRDPLAADPRRFLEAAQIAPDKVVWHWEPYQALHATFILARAKTALQPPATVTLTLEETTLVARGTASPAWIANAGLLVRALPGITQYRDDDLVDTDTRLLRLATAHLVPPESVTLHVASGVLTATGAAPHAWIVQARTRVLELPGLGQYHDSNLEDSDLKKFIAMKARLEQMTFLFIENEALLVPGQEDRFQELHAGLQTLQTLAHTVGKRFRVEIVGHTDGRGREAANQRLSQERAEYVFTMLAARGVDRTMMTSTGVGTREIIRKEVTDEDRAVHRRVSFRISVLDEP